MTGVTASGEGDPLGNVSRETLQRLKHFEDLLRKWTPRINLVAPSTLEVLWTRHIVDSAQVYQISCHRSGVWLDMGSGAGLPGLVCVILAADAGAGLTFHLVDSDKRKATFLMTAIRELDLPARVHAVRIEDLPPMEASVVTARALAPLERLLAFAQVHLIPGGEAIFPKGARAAEEISQAREHWRFKLQSFPSITDPSASLLKIGEIQRA